MRKPCLRALNLILGLTVNQDFNAPRHGKTNSHWSFPKKWNCTGMIIGYQRETCTSKETCWASFLGVCTVTCFFNALLMMNQSQCNADVSL